MNNQNQQNQQQQQQQQAGGGANQEDVEQKQSDIGQAAQAAPATLPSYETVPPDEGVDNSTGKDKKIFKLISFDKSREINICKIQFDIFRGSWVLKKVKLYG